MILGLDFQALVDDMVETMRLAPGVGLAAPQVGESIRLIVVEYGDEENEEIPPKLYVMANPEITHSSQDTLIGTEGCLSIPRYSGRCGTLRSSDGQGIEPAWSTDDRQGQRLAGAHLPARDRPPGRHIVC